MRVGMPMRAALLLLIASVILTAATAFPHAMPMGGSRWCIGKHGLVANIDLNQLLMMEIPGIKEGRFDLAGSSDQQLQQIAVQVVQPYLDRRLQVTINGKRSPLKVDRLVRNGGSDVYTIWLSAERSCFPQPENVLKIDYGLLFPETDNAHVNLAFLYRTDVTGEALRKVFDFSPPNGQHNFASGDRIWEISVPGSASVPKKAPTAAQRLMVAAKADPIPPAVVAGDGDAVAVAAKNEALPTAPPVSTEKDPASKASVATVDAGSASRVAPQPAANREARSSFLDNVRQFLLLGIEHILTGYDHIAFLIGLIVIGLSFREVLKIITAFTVAHSITLLLAALQIISLNSRFVESVIALSICYVALENIFRKEVRYRWLVTFCFGLIHGFGFASALQELIVGESRLLISVVSFNLGVETGQLMIFFVLLPVLSLLRRKMEFRKVTAAVSCAIFVFGFTWLIERLFDMKLFS